MACPWSASGGARPCTATAGENVSATRMLHDGRHKLIWYPAGNHLQLFDLEADPDELHDRADDQDYASDPGRLAQPLADQLYGADIEQGWVEDGRLVGFEAPPYEEHRRSWPERAARPALSPAAPCRPGRDGRFPDLSRQGWARRRGRRSCQSQKCVMISVEN